MSVEAVHELSETKKAINWDSQEPYNELGMSFDVWNWTMLYAFGSLFVLQFVWLVRMFIRRSMYLQSATKFEKCQCCWSFLGLEDLDDVRNQFFFVCLCL